MYYIFTHECNERVNFFYFIFILFYLFLTRLVSFFVLFEASSLYRRSGGGRDKCAK